MWVEELMTPNIVTVPIHRTVAMGLQVARAAGVHHLLLTRRGRLTSVTCVCELELRDQTLPLSVVSPRHLHVIEAEAPIEVAARRFVEKGVGCFPVLWGTELVGVLTRGDLRRAELPEDAWPTSFSCTYCGDTRHVRPVAGQPGLSTCFGCARRVGSSDAYDVGGSG